MNKKLVGTVWAVPFLILSLLAAHSAKADTYDPFYLPSELPDVIILNGELTARAGLALKRAIAARPNAKTIALNSPGGAVQMSLLIAQEVFDRALNTMVPEGASCSSACAFVFFAGRERRANGQLGVHQMSGGKDNDIDTQNNVSDIIETLSRFGTSADVFSTMFRTPPDSMHFFTTQELADFGINRSGYEAAPNVASSTPAPTRPTPPAPEPQATATAPTYSNPEAKPAPRTASLSPSQYPEMAKEYVKTLVQMHSDRYSTQLTTLTDAYGNNVLYYGSLKSRLEILEDKSAYFKRWPTRFYSARPETLASNCTGNICEVTGLYDWSVSSAPRNKSANGIASFTYRLDMSGDGFVVFEDSKVLK